MMDFETYMSLFEQIQKDKKTPYDDSSFVELAKLNFTRTKRWLKIGEIKEALKKEISTIREKQNWEVITEHWCGDSANILPFIYKMSTLNPLITLNIQLRDSNSEIDAYLSDGKKSIPIFICRDQNGKDIFTWKSRPKKAQDYYNEEKKTINDSNELKKRLQIWYNTDQGASLQNELITIFKCDLNHILTSKI